MVLRCVGRRGGGPSIHPMAWGANVARTPPTPTLVWLWLRPMPCWMVDGWVDGGGRWRERWMGGLVWSTEGSMQDSPDIHRAGASHLSSLSLHSLLSLLSSYRRFSRRIVHLSIHAARLHRPKRPRCLQADLTYLVYRKAFLVFLPHLPLPIITNSTRKNKTKKDPVPRYQVRTLCLCSDSSPRRVLRCPC